MEAAVNRAWEMRQKFGLRAGVIANLLTPDNTDNGVWLGRGGVDKANCYSGKSTGVAKHSYTHLHCLDQKGRGCMVWTDFNASLQRHGNSEETIARFGNFVKECGASEIFCAADVSSDNVSLALCTDGAAGDDGVIQLVLPVYCSKAGMEVTMRLLTSETAASSYFTCFSSTFCDRSRAGRHGHGSGRGVLRKDVRGRRRHDWWTGMPLRAVPSDAAFLKPDQSII